MSYLFDRCTAAESARERAEADLEQADEQMLRYDRERRAAVEAVQGEREHAERLQRQNEVQAKLIGRLRERAQRAEKRIAELGSECVTCGGRGTRTGKRFVELLDGRTVYREQEHPCPDCRVETQNETTQ